MRHRITTFTAVLAIAIASLAALPVLGQKLSKKEKAEEAAKRSVEGVVQDEDGKNIDGAVVQLKDLKSLQVRSFITKDDGKFHFYGLSTNIDYEVRAESGGMASKTRTLSVFDQRKKAIMDLKLEKK